MTEQQQRVFSQQYLDDAGVPTVALMARSLEAGEVVRLPAFADQLRQEIVTMYFSYRAWDQVITREIMRREGKKITREVIIDCRQRAGIKREEKADTEQLWSQLMTQIDEAKSSENWQQLYSVCQQFQDDGVRVHDHMMTHVTGLLSHVYRQYGEPVLASLLTDIMNPEGMQLSPDMEFRERVETIIKFTRVHLQPFKLLEDKEKVTFIADPCPSGGRLVLQGSYADGNDNSHEKSDESSAKGVQIQGPTPLSYGRETLPVYCCHEPAMEMALIEKEGAPLFVVDPSNDIGRVPCHVHMYKRPQDIPEPFYQRLGLNKPEDLIASTSRH